MMSSKRPLAQAYAVALLSVISAFVLTMLFPALREHTPFALFYAAVAVSAWFLGPGPGLLATVVSALLGAYFFLPPTLSFSITSAADWVVLGVFVLVAVLMSLITVARERAQNIARAQTRRHAVVANLGERALTTTNLHALMDNVAARVAETLGVEFVTVLELLLEQSTLLLRAGYGWKPDVMGKAQVGAGTGSQAGYTLQANQPIIVTDWRTEKRFETPPLVNEYQIVSGMSVVIPGRRQPYGVLGIQTTRRWSFSQDDIDFVQSAANVLAAAIQRSRTEEAIREQRESLRVTLSSIGDAVIATDTEGHITLMNPVAEALTGWKQSEAVGKELEQVFDIINEKTRQPVDNPAARVLREGRVVGLANHTVLVTEDGREIPIEDSAAPIQNENGETIGVVLVFRDVREQRHAQEVLAASERRFRALIENSSDAIAMLSADGTFTYASPSTTRVLGYTPDELVGRDPFELIHPDDLHIASNVFDQLQRPGATAAALVRERHKDGSWRWIESTGTNMVNEPSVGAIVSNYRDVTERRRTEDALRESEERYRRIVETAQEGIWIIDAQGNTTFANKKMAELFGYSVEEMVGKPLVAFLDEEGRANTSSNLERLRAGAEQQGDYKFLRKDGTELWTLVTTTPLYDRDGRYGGALAMLSDITDRKRAEEDLRRSRDQLEIILRGITDGITVQDRRGKLLFANEAAARIIGFSSVQELLSAPVEQVMQRFEVRDESGKLLPLTELPGRVALEGKQPREEILRFRVLASGEERWSVVNAVPLFDERGQVRSAINIFRDFTIRKRAEQRLAAQYNSTRILSEANTLEEATPKILKSICTSLGWQVGALWQVDASENILRCIDLWHAPALSIPEFEAATRQSTFASGVGLPGRVWQSGEPAWIQNVTEDPNFPRAEIAAREGLYAAFSFPVRLGTEFLGVLEFFSDEIRQPQADLLGMLGTIGAQIGQFIERHRAEAALRESEDRYRTVAETASDAIITIDENSQVLFANPAIELIFGYEPEELMGQSITLLMPERLRDQHRNALVRFLATGQKHIPWRGVELVGRHKSGAEIPIEISFGEFVKQGRHFFTGIVRDLTERRQANETLYKTNSILNAVIESANDAIYVKDLQGRYLLINQHGARAVGKSVQDFIGKDDTEVLTPEVGQTLMTEDRRVMKSGQAETLENIVPVDGSLRTFLSVKSPYRDPEGNVIGVIGISSDITERKETETAIARLAAIVEQSNDAIIGKTLDAVIVSWNPGAERLYGYSTEEVIGKPISILIPPEHADELPTIMERISRGERITPYETVRRHKDGKLIDVSISISPLKDKSGSIIGAATIARDITERKRIDEQLRFQANILQNVRDSVIVTDEHGRVTYWNQGAQALFGYLAQEMFGQSVALLYPDQNPDQLDLQLEDISEGHDFVGEWRGRRKDGSPIWVDIKTTFMRDAAGEVSGFIGVSKDITQRKQAEEEERFLSEATALLSSSLDYATTLARVAQLAVPHVADWCSVEIVKDDGTTEQLALTHVDPSKVSWARELQRRYPPDPNSSSGVPKVLRTGKSELVPEIPDEVIVAAAKDPEHLKILREVGMRSFMIVPLIARGKTVGAISFVSAESGRRYGQEDLRFAEELARRAAIAVDNAKLYQAEQAARLAAERAANRTARLQEITAALSEALTPAQVSEVVVQQGVAALGANAGVIALLQEDGKQLQIISSVGYPHELIEKHSKIALAGGTPLARAVRSGESVWLESAAEHTTRFPALTNINAYVNDRAWAAIPLIIEGKAIGGLGLSWHEDRPFSENERGFMVALTRQCVQALERARLYEAEQRARAEAEAAQQREAFIAEASSIVAASLDYHATLERVARLAVQFLADWCAIDLIGNDGEIEQVAVAHVDPAQEELVRELRRRYPPTLHDSHPILRVLQSGEAELATEVTDDQLAARALDADHLEMLRALNIRSHIVVPLNARGRTLGTISIIYTSPARRYGPTELGLARDLARRTAVAIDNARLYHEAQAAVRLRDQFLSIASHELKTPLTSLLGYAELLQRRTAREGALKERDHRALRIIATQAVRLNKLIGALLDLSRIQTGQLSIEHAQVDLNNLAQRLVEDIQLTLDRHKLEYFGTEEPLLVDGDEIRLEQVLQNLIQNAIKYSPRGGPIRVQVEHVDDRACVHVTDQGIGIPEAALPQLFRRFYRAQNVEASHISGMGVGLYVVKEIVNLHGGTIAVESREGEGSVFTVCLPATPGQRVETREDGFEATQSKIPRRR